MKINLDEDDICSVIYLWILSIGSAATLFVVVIGLIGTINIAITVATDEHLKNIGDLMQLVIKESPIQVKTNN